MRQSNFELLRIVSMLMVLTVHADGASLGLPEVRGDWEALTTRDVWRLVVESIAIIGVNCFTLISGYFGIRLRWKSALSFIFQCLFYSVGLATVFGIAFPSHFSITAWAESWLVLSHTDLWYVPAYFGLMLLSPVLNAGIENMSCKQLGAFASGFLLFNLWCGWFWEGSFNPTGYTLVQLIMMYLIGRYIKIADFRISKTTTLALYTASVAAIFATSVYLPTLKAFAYNSPFVVAASVLFLLLFKELQFKSQAINFFASSAFAVYLFHKAPLFWGNAMKPTVIKMWQSMNLVEFTFAVAGLIVAIYLFATALDLIRRKIWAWIS